MFALVAFLVVWTGTLGDRTNGDAVDVTSSTSHVDCLLRYVLCTDPGTIDDNHPGLSVKILGFLKRWTPRTFASLPDGVFRDRMTEPWNGTASIGFLLRISLVLLSSSWMGMRGLVHLRLLRGPPLS